MQFLTMLIAILMVGIFPLNATAKIPIGVELGPTTLFMGTLTADGNYWYFLSPDHPAAQTAKTVSGKPNYYFYGDMQEGGFTYDWTFDLTGAGLSKRGITRTDKNFNWKNGKKVSYSHAELLNHYGLSAYIMPSEYRFPCGGIHSMEPFSRLAAWISEESEFKDIWDDGFFAGFVGNSCSEKSIGGRTVQVADRNPGGFIIGNRNISADKYASLEANLVQPVKYRSFMQNDQYVVTFRLMLVNPPPTVSGNPAIATFYIHSRGKLDSLVVSYLDFSPNARKGGVWDNIGKTFNNSILRNNTRFAMRWNAPEFVSTNGQKSRIQVAVSDFGYEQVSHERLFPGRSSMPNGTYWTAFTECLGGMITSVDNFTPFDNLAGFMAWEPWVYGYATVRKIKETTRLAGKYDFTALYNGYGREGMIEWLDDKTGPGVSSMVFDPAPITWKHWDKSRSEGDSISIQDAWNNLIYQQQNMPGRWGKDFGLRPAAESARAAKKPLWAGIQGYGSITRIDWEKNPDGSPKLYWVQTPYLGDPTPNMVKCQAFIAMSFGAQGFFYSYYAPVYERSGSYLNYYAAPPKGVYGFNGATSSGLTTFWPSETDSLIRDDGPALDADINTLNVARGAKWSAEGAPGLFGDNDRPGTGVLKPNAKWWAARRFNLYVDSVSYVYEGIVWKESECIAEKEDVGYVRGLVTSTKADFNIIEPVSRRMVQVGILEKKSAKPADPRYFVLVNRRCDHAGGRWIRCTIQFGDSQAHYIRDVATKATVASGVGDITFDYYLDPAEGRLLEAGNGY